MKVLVVEDNEPFRHFLLEYLARWFNAFVEAENADDAVRIYRAERPDVVLMDIALDAGTDGIEAAGRIVRFDAAAKIVMLTSYDEQDIRDAATAAGAVGYVLKKDLGLLGKTIGLLGYPERVL